MPQDICLRTDHRAAMQARFPHFERLFEYDASTGRILSVNAMFNHNGHAAPILHEFITWMVPSEAGNISRFCDCEEFGWAVGMSPWGFPIFPPSKM
jgi:hypothetical protein